MKHFINDRSAIVTEALDTVVRLSGGKLARLDGFPAIKVVVRTDADRSKVAVISGGGAGHEPAHVGFVAEGLLTAAVCGEIFASPSVDAVLAAIIAVTGPAGALLVVKNYTGDRLNFGLAAEKARALGLAVETVVVGDDVATADARNPRGLAGTLFVHKVAGHFASAGAPLAEVKATADRVARSVVTIGLSLSTAEIPGSAAPSSEPRIGPDQVELGLGIHGEPGASLVPFAPVAELAATMTRVLVDALIARNLLGPVALLVNDLGGVSPLEMGVATRSVLDAMPGVSLVFGPDRLMTSLDMKGFSISALPMNPDIDAALRSSAPPFPAARTDGEATVFPLPDAIRLRTFTASTDPARCSVVERVCTALAGREAELDALDARVGDGDAGTTIATAARALLADLDALPFADGPMLCAAVADRLSRTMGGSSGVLLAIFVAAMGPRAPDWIPAMRDGLDRMMTYGGAQPGDRTMIDALGPAVAALEAGEGLAGAARAARAGADATAGMKARAGRSSYVRPEALAGIPDPGAVAIAHAFQSLVG